MRDAQTDASRCDYPGCISPVVPDVGHCHNSCCEGERAFCEAHLPKHNAQRFLDQLGQGYGYYDEQHDEVLELVLHVIDELGR